MASPARGALSPVRDASHVGHQLRCPGAQRYIDSWADEFAAWGVDYVRLDGVLEAGREQVFTKNWAERNVVHRHLQYRHGIPADVPHTSEPARNRQPDPGHRPVDRPFRRNRERHLYGGTYTTDVAPGGVTLIAAAPA